MKKRTKIALIFSAFLAAAAISSAALLLKINSGNTAVVKSDGRVLYKIQLDKVESPYFLDVKNDRGYNKIYVEKGKISVIEADCTDKICVKQSESGIYPIVCLPHRLVVEMK